MQLYAWLFNPSFNESIAIKYLDQDATDVYDIPVRDFLPALAVCDSFEESVVNGDITNCNNLDHWNVKFRQFISGE